MPVVDRNKCEGKSDCVRVCPYHVFEVRRIDDADFSNLSLIGKLKSVAHGRKTAYTPLLVVMFEDGSSVGSGGGGVAAAMDDVHDLPFAASKLGEVG